MSLSKKNLILIGVSVFLSMMFIDETGVAVMLPHMQHDLAMDYYGGQWIMNGMFLPLAVLVLFAGRLSDIIGHRKVFTIGIIVFFIASALCAYANDPITIIVGRVMQGMGASFLLATYAVLISIVYPVEERGKALGTCASVASIFLALGPFIGGAFEHYFTWRFLFAINIPLCVLCLVFIYLAIDKDNSNLQSEKMDISGSCLFISGFTLLVYALMHSSNSGWMDNVTIVSLIFSLIMLAIFIFSQNQKHSPLADLTLFKNRNFLAGNIILFSTQVVVMSLTYWAIWLQQSLHFTPLNAGIALLPAGLPILVTARWGGILLDRNGPKLPITLGCCIVLIGMIWLAITAKYQSYWISSLGFLAYGIGAPFIISPAIAVVLNSVEASKRGMASGMLNTMRQLGATLCFALVGVVIADNYSMQLSSGNNIALSDAYTNAFASGMGVSALFALISTYCALKLLRNI